MTVLKQHCPECNRKLPLSEFSEAKRTLDGAPSHHKICKSCVSERRRKAAKPIGNTKVCISCHHELGIENFPLAKVRKSDGVRGRRGRCKSCTALMGKAIRVRSMKETKPGTFVSEFDGGISGTLAEIAASIDVTEIELREMIGRGCPIISAAGVYHASIWHVRRWIEGKPRQPDFNALPRSLTGCPLAA
jgi:hypothetical protein